MAKRARKSAQVQFSSKDGTNPWIMKIEQANRTFGMSKWETACDIIRKKYRYESSTSVRTRKYQMLWSNVEVLKGATYAKPPQAVVTRRYLDKDDTARQAGVMIERCVNFTFDAEDYDTKFKQVRDDFLLYARGQARVIYEPVMEAVDMPDDGLDVAAVEGPAQEEADLNEQAAEQGRSPPEEILKFEKVKLKYVQREDFVHAPARTWDEVPWVAFREFLTREELVARFGEDLGNKIGLDAKSSANTENTARTGDGSDEEKATIYEIWDKANNRVLWVAVSWPDVLEESEPYLKMTGFFPCPRPAYGTLTNETLAPRPDYIFYQDQCEEIDKLTQRIGSLEDSLKVVGFYPAGPAGEGSPEVERAATPGVENKLIAVKNWAMFSEGGKGGAPIVWYPIDQVIKVLEGCVKLRAQLIEDVYQITGISDIVRGATDPNETKGAQVLKSQFGSLRIRTKQGELARFCRDISRLVGEIICNHFQPETIMAMANMPLPTDEDVLNQLREEIAQHAMELAAAQRQQSMMGHNGGPPMGAPAALPAPQPMGAHP